MKHETQDTWLKSPGVLLLARHPGKLNSCKDDFAHLVDHLEESFTWSQIKTYSPPVKTSKLPCWEHNWDAWAWMDDFFHSNYLSRGTPIQVCVLMMYNSRFWSHLGYVFSTKNALNSIFKAPFPAFSWVISGAVYYKHRLLSWTAATSLLQILSHCGSIF